MVVLLSDVCKDEDIIKEYTFASNLQQITADVAFEYCACWKENAPRCVEMTIGDLVGWMAGQGSVMD